MANEKIGIYAFLIGIVIAILAGIIAVYVTGVSEWVAFVLVIIGIIVGFLNIKDKEITTFLIAAIALTVAGSAFMPLQTLVPGLGNLVSQIVGYISMFVAPAAIIVALKAIWNIAKAP